MKNLLLAALLAASCTRLWALNQNQTGAASFLSSGLGARALGMGGAFVAVADDATAEYWNPAGLTRLGVEGTQFASMYSSMRQDRALNYLSFAQHFEKWGDLGIGLAQYGVNNIEAFDVNGNAAGMLQDQEFRGSVSVASQIDYQFRWGGTVKLLHQELAGSAAWGYSADVGLLMQPALAKDVILAFNLQNPVSLLAWDTGRYDKVSPNLKIGASDRFFDWSLIVAGDLDVPVGVTGDVIPHLGAEYWFGRVWALRAGFNGSAFTAGASWQYEFYEFDYAYGLDLSGLGDSQQLSVLLKF